MGHSNEAAIRARAYQLWENGGRVHGHHDAHWRQAEQELGGAATDAAQTAREMGAAGTSGGHVDGVSTLPHPDETVELP